MRLAYFVDEYPPFFRGGLGTYALEITRRFAAEGHPVTVFTRNRGDDPARECRAGIEVHRPRLMDFARVVSVLVPDEVNRWDPGGRRFFQETLHYNVMAAAKLVNLLVKSEGRRPDIVVAHDWLAAIGGVLAARNLDLPFVFHFHSTEHGRAGNGSPTVGEIERIAAREADLIVTVSYAMRDELVRLGVPEEKIRVVHNGVDTSKYRPDAVSGKEVRAFRAAIGVGDAPVVFFIGRLTWVAADPCRRARRPPCHPRLRGGGGAHRPADPGARPRTGGRQDPLNRR
jgi:glycogen(starch) synthase